MKNIWTKNTNKEIDEKNDEIEKKNQTDHHKKKK